MVAHIRATDFLLVLALGTIGHHSTVGLVAASRAQSTQPFRWEGRLPAGSVLEIKGVNGQIHAGPAAGSGVTVVADRHANRHNPADVTIEVVEHEGGVTICAVYPSPDGSNECRPGSSGRINARDNDVRVDFTVQVPAGVHFVGRTVNGDVEIDEVPGNAEAYAVNGSVRLASRGFAQAETVNGSITASLGRADWAHAREFRTVNGSIALKLPADVSAAFRADTVNGSITSDFPVTVSGRVSPKRLRGTIGSTEPEPASRELVLHTVNGDIQLRRTSN
jgi:hypothetical protein